MLSRSLFAAVLLCAPVLAQPKVDGPVVIFIGPPGSGKSTQAASAARLLNLPIVAVDDLIAANKAEFDKIRKSKITGMEPQSDPILNRLFLTRLEQGGLSKGMILDGYPSTKDHGDYLGGLVQKGILPKPLVLELLIPDKDVLKRTEKDNKEPRTAVEQRLKDYHREMDMVRLYFPNAEIVTVDGTKKPKDVEKNIAEILRKRFKP